MQQKYKLLMKIKLTRNGGLLPVKKSAEAEIDIKIEELDRLLDLIKADPSAIRIKDGTIYDLSVGNTVTRVDLERVPKEYQVFFEKLKLALKVVKPV